MFLSLSRQKQENEMSLPQYTHQEHNEILSILLRHVSFVYSNNQTLINLNAL
jgi:hypothetical protein